jgi:hypothetical protein
LARISGATVWWIDPETSGLRASYIPSAAVAPGTDYASEAERRMPSGVVHKDIVPDGESPDAAVKRLGKIAADLKASQA